MVIDTYKKLKKFLSENKGSKKRLLLHSCCAPCSSYVLELLKEVFDITIFFYNPNIYPQEEYIKRLSEFNKLYKFPIMEEKYNPNEFNKAIKGLEHIPEGGERCFACYSFRLEKTAQVARKKGYEYFTTTLSISPYKNSKKINEIGYECERKYGVKYLYSDFKKEEGYKKSIILSKELDLYRQEYCGCFYSMQEQQDRRKNKAKT
ncbi:MAG TPA: epoxyqueuosine reductase QueH [Acholeplasmataceae bacterium]|nr:epoxyqueuosine reductase QueH [Acholeplasmataceae bacterium]